MVVHQTPDLWVKTLVINGWGRLSLQIHERRNELWHTADSHLHATIGDTELTLSPYRVYIVPAGTVHRLWNPTADEISLVEVATGVPDEDDIIRLEDDYGRTDDGLV